MLSPVACASGDSFLTLTIMQHFIRITTAALSMFTLNTDCMPNLESSADLQKLGEGRIIEKDGSEYRHIRLKQVKTFGIVYVKDGSLHDKPIEKIARLEFPVTEWGFVTITFPDNKPEIFVYAKIR